MTHWQRPKRFQFDELEKIDTAHSWYEVYKLPQNIYAICEPHHFQEIISFLIVGDTKALLWDTGMGIFPIMPIVKHLTQLSVIAVNSHSHFDHVGSNSEFDAVYGFVNKVSSDRAANCWKPSDSDENFYPQAFEAGFDCPPDFVQAGYKLKEVTDNTVFDIGGRIWKVLHTPGHSSDSIVLYCEKEKLVLTGDTVYPGTIYAQQNLQQYADTCRRLAEKFGDYTLLCSHNEPMRKGEYILQLCEAFDAVLNNKTNPRHCEGGLYVHTWKEISILTGISG